MRRKKISLAIVTVIITLLLCEAVLRMLGYKAGTFRKLDGFKIVDSLIVYKNYTTDTAGVYKFSTWVYDSLNIYFDCKNGKIGNLNTAKNLDPVDNLEYISQSFCRLKDPTSANSLFWKITRWYEENGDTSEFANVYHALLLQKPDTTDEWASALIDYVQHPYNREGFRSIAFRQYKTKRKKILLIGDSFVYGMSARPFYNSFADILLSRGYIVYSAGIPGTDPAQYAAIAREYIPLLKPDIVVTCFYEGNDYMPFAREPVLNQPHEHITNAGFYESAPLGQYLDAYQGYNYYKTLVLIPDTKTNTFNNICSKSALTGLLWGALYKMKITRHQALDFADSVMYRGKKDMAFTASRIYLIDSVCKAQQTKLKLIIIPDPHINDNEKNPHVAIDKKQADMIAGKTPYYTPNDLVEKTDFPNDDYHFNNRGSTKFANFLDSLLRQP